MSNTPALDDLFEHRITYPDVEAQERLARLVGLDDQKARLTKILGLLVNPAGLEAWAKRHHPGANGLLTSVLRRPPLVVLAGDVGSGKSELAETIGDAVARQEKIDIALFPMSLSTRGQGRVGEMTQLLSAAFDHTIAEASKLKGSSGRAARGRHSACRRSRRARAIARSRADAPRGPCRRERLHPRHRPHRQRSPAGRRHHVHQPAWRARSGRKAAGGRHSGLRAPRRRRSGTPCSASRSSSSVFRSRRSTPWWRRPARRRAALMVSLSPT